MLRIYFLQQWFNLSDPAAEDALYDTAAMSSFAGIDLGRPAAPDETTICHFRHLLERHHLGRRLLKTGTCTSSTTESKSQARSSTRRSSMRRVRPRTAGKRDPEMHQTTKGQQWYFGMKAHVAVDSHTKLFHSVLVAPANVADSQVLRDLLAGGDVSGRSGLPG